MSNLQVGGLISGTDVQGIIEKILVVRARPIKTLSNNIEEVERDVAAWADINTDMTALNDSLDTLRQWNTWNKMTAISSDTSRLTATATTSAVAGVYSIAINRLAQSHSVSSDRAEYLSPGANAKTDLVAAGVLNAGDEFAIEGQTITIGATESLETLKDKISLANSGIPTANKVTAIILDDRLVVTRNNTGSTEISMSEIVGTPLQALNIFDALGNYSNELVAAQDAEFTVNGAVVNRESNTSLTTVLPGVTLNLHDTTLTNITLEIESDKENAKDAILDFIEKYNAAAAKLNHYAQATVYDTTMRGAGVDEVGELQNDPLIHEIIRNMRTLAMESKFPYLNQINASYTYNGRDGICNSLQTIGVSTSSRDNQLAVNDETRLDYMLDNYFDEVTQLFRGVYDDEKGYANGVATDFYRYTENITAAMTGSIARRNARLSEQITDLNTRIDRITTDIDREEKFLWARFGAMEDTIARLQGQLSYLTSQLGMS